MILKLLLFVRSFFFLKLNSFSSSGKSFIPSVKLLCIGMFFVVIHSNATTYYSRVTTGNFATLGTWSTSPTGSPVNSTALNNADVFVIQNGNTITVAATQTIAGLTVDLGGILTVQGINFTVTGSTSISGNINFTSTTNTKIFTGLVTVNSGGTWNNTSNNSPITFRGGIANNGTFNTGTGIQTFNTSTQTITGSLSIPTVVITGVNLTNNGTLTISSGISGTGTLTNASSYTLSGSSTITNFSNSGTALLTGSASSSTALASFINTGTINLNTTGAITGITNSTGGLVNLTNSGTITSFNNSTATSVFNISDPTVPTINTLTATAVGNTVNYSATAAQTVKSTTYNNLTLSGSGIKTTSSVTVNGILSMEGTTTASAALTYGSSSTLQYNTTTSRTTSNLEWPATFSGSGGVVINNSGVITLNSAKNITNGFSIASGAKVNLGTFTHTAGTLILNNSSTVAGSWGSTASTAVNKNNTYFDVTANGIVNVGCTFNFANVAPITNVRLNTLNNPSSAATSSSAYEDFASTSSTSLIRGQSYTISVNGNTIGNNNFYYTAFVDWNQDGDFDDSGEYYEIGTITSSSGTDGKIASVYFPVPVGAVLGNTRMRVISHFNAYNTTPCSSVDGNSYGQVEDYLITVQDVCASAPVPGNTVSSASSVCPNTPFTLSLQNTLADGTTYVWQTSPDGNNPWTNALPTPTTFFSNTFSTPQSANTTVGDISLYGDDTSITGGELVLTKLNGGYIGGFVIQSTPGSNINAFTTTFDYKIYGGTGADGLSLSYASNIANNAGGGESGEGSGIVLQLDTYDNEGIATGSRVRILYNGIPIFNSAINVPFNLRTATARNVTLTVDNNGNLFLSIGGTTVVSNLILPANYLSSDKSNWKFKFSARTGGSTDNHIIDNLTIKYLDVASTNPTLTISQTVPTYYRALVTCGSTVASTPVFVNVTSAVINPMTASVCTALPFTVTPTNGTNGSIPSGTTYSWTVPTVTGGMTGGATSSGSPTSISGTLVNSTASAQTATYTVTPTTGSCTGMPFILTVTVNPLPVAPTASATSQPTCTVNTGTITITSPSPAAGITYSIDGSTYTNTTGVFNNVAVGSYNVTVKNSSDCVSLATTVSINPPTVKTWNGSSSTIWNTAANWTPNGIPTSSDCVVVPTGVPQPVISTADAFAQILTVNNNASLSVQSSYTLNVVDGITVLGTGALVFENHSALMQSNTSPTINTGNITYKRIAVQIRRGDFVYWSTPVSPQKLFDVSPFTLSDKYFGFNGDNWVETNSNTTMVVGKGYIIRAPSSFSITAKADYPASFIGTPNNGDLSGETLVANKNYLIGNPYPSALDAKKFLGANLFLDGTLYFWTHNTPVNLSGAYQYDGNDYASYNLTGGTATSLPAPSGSIPGNDSRMPSGKIAAGQSFFASTNAGGTVTFNNLMRLPAADNTQFFKPGKTSKSTETNRLWLNMTNEDGLFKQMLIGYVEGATNEFENRYDGVSFDGNPYLDFYSVGNGNKYVIQGRALPFTDTDMVSLGYRSSVEGKFTISIDQVEGDLSNQDIYLEDKTTGKIHDLRSSNYTFTTAIGTFTDRFVLRYTNKTLGIGDIENPDNSILVSVKDKVVKVTSTKENIKQVTLFDVSGKQLYSKNKVGATELQLQNLPIGNQVLLVNITLENGYVTAKKIILK